MIPLDQQGSYVTFYRIRIGTWGSQPEDIGGCKLGCLGIPEFGTDFAMQMLIDTKPQYFLGSCPNIRSVPWYGRVARQRTDTDRRG